MNENYEKIAIEYIAVEITRKCQLRCAHCMKGDAQNVNMSTEVIDKLLESVVSIGTLTFTGGEPTMNLDGMQYFLNVMKDKGIPLHKFSMVTNGCSISENIIKLIKEYHDYIDYDNEYGANKVIISISDDVYHRESGSNPEDAFQKYIKVFKDYPQIHVMKYGIGNTPKKTGRAKQLEESVIDILEYMPPQKLEIMTAHSHNYCICRKYYKLEDGVNAIIMCPSVLSVYGNLSHIGTTDVDYETFDKIGVSIKENGVLKAIHLYNQKTEDCITWGMIKENVINHPAIMKKFFEAERKYTFSIDEYDKIKENQIEYFVSEDEKNAIITDWHDAVGRKAISNVPRMVMDIVGKIDSRYQETQEMSKIALKIIGNIMPTYNSAYYGDREKESFKDDAERHVREEHPDWEHVDCIRYANSQKWVDYYSEHGKCPNTLLFMKHLMTIQSIVEKYK